MLFFRLPTGFLPTEDQGAATVQFRLPAGATMGRTREVQLAIEDYFLKGPEKKNVDDLFHRRRRRRQGAAGQNTGQSFINLAPYDERQGSGEQRRRDRPARLRGVPRTSATRRFSR